MLVFVAAVFCDAEIQSTLRALKSGSKGQLVILAKGQLGGIFSILFPQKQLG